ncbi:branched-chain amino acid ABC transporter permease (plasmid) [Tistrella mobilis]|uniref:ABC transporter permease subunit n=1 Tax=Tistrella mobilis TaxID=171437 RepID=UPI0035588764
MGLDIRTVSKAGQTIGVLIAALLIVFMPAMVELFDLMQYTIFVVMGVLALSLGFIWGFGGILSFGQTAFFGLGAYTFAVTAINTDGGWAAVGLAVLVPAIFAAVLGYFMFYGRISDVYLGVITLTVTLILFNVVNSTAGDAYTIGNAALGGFNGIPAVPGLSMPGDPDFFFGPEENWYLSAGCLLLVYLALKGLLRTHFGRVVVAVRENETRAALLGYDPRIYKLMVFVVGGAVAGLAGGLFTNWGAFVSPTVFSLSTAAQIIIWVTIGGLGTLVGPVLGCFIMQYLVMQIGTQQTFNADLVMGAILLGFVMAIPMGLVPLMRLGLVGLVMRLLPGKARASDATVTETTAVEGAK